MPPSADDSLVTSSTLKVLVHTQQLNDWLVTSNTQLP